MSTLDVAYLGPPGTYSEKVAELHFGARARRVPLPSIRAVCAYVAADPRRRGVAPIENSSGGAVYEMVDILLAGRPRVRIREELALNVQLALLGRRNERIRMLYSHFVPLDHCAGWIRRRLPRADREAVASTAAAVRRAWEQPHAAALAQRDLAPAWHLDVLEYPVAADVPNVTVFYVIGGPAQAEPDANKQTLAVTLPNVPGSLCNLLECFRDQGVNLARLISRPLRGCPREYAFLVDIEGSPAAAPVRRALRLARRAATRLRVISAYSTGTTYTS